MGHFRVLKHVTFKITPRAKPERLQNHSSFETNALRRLVKGLLYVLKVTSCTTSSLLLLSNNDLLRGPR